MAATGGNDLAGRQLGEFLVRDKIGEGGGGQVWRATQEALGRDVVLKVVTSRANVAVDALVEEARVASRLDHPYAAHVYGVGRERDGLVWIAMELVRGTPLDEILRAQGPMSLARFVPFFERLCEVVDVAHERGIVHRDIKPSNVMAVATGGRLLPKLLDFGIARLRALAPDAAATHGAIGSPAYMAPELRLDPSAADPRLDVYALAAFAYEVLSGQRADAQRPAPLADELGAAVDAALQRGLAASPAQRFASPGELAAALRAASGLDDEPPALPRFDDALCEAVPARAPQPVAETFAMCEAARNAHQARDALVAFVDTTVHWLGVMALAARSRLGASFEAPALTSLLHELSRRALSCREWAAVIEEACRPFRLRREVFPFPELVALARPIEGERASTVGALAALRDEVAAAVDEEEVRAALARAIAALNTLLRGCPVLGEYAVVVPRGRIGELWVGVRRPRRLAILLRGASLPEGRPVLCDAEANPIAALWPLVQTTAPAPGEPDEMFLLAGGQRGTARLIAPPRGFEVSDDRVWEWLAAQSAVSEAPDASSPQRERTPYRGLETFTSDDASMFFGREREADALVNRLRAHSLIAVVGPSGAGKSSFVQAGVVPRLPRGWRALTVRPGPDPMGSLRAVLARGGARITGDAPADFAAALQRLAAERDGAVVLVVDQLEELFTLCHDDGARADYAAALAECAASPEQGVRVIATLRDDFLIRAEQLAPFRHRLGHGLWLLTTPAVDDLLRIVVEPARRSGYDFDDATLPAEMVRQVSDEPGALALISFTATKLWELRDRHFHLLRRRAYDGLGGVGGALAQHAEDTIAHMPVEDVPLVRETFRHLVTAQGTRATLTRGELRDVLKQRDRADRVVEQLVAARLLVASEAAEGGERIEIVHEALLGAWPRLLTWQREDAEGARLRDQVRAAARQWEERGRPRGLLWRDDALAEYRLWRARFPGALTRSEEAFAGASLADAARGRRVRRTILVAALAVLSVAVVALLTFNRIAQRERARAERESDRAHDRILDLYQEQGRQSLLAGNTYEALAYLAEAYGQGADGPALRNLLGQAMRVLDSQELVLYAHGAAVHDFDFSPDGDQLVTAGGDAKVKLWDLGTGRLMRTFEGHTAAVRTVRFSPDGRRILTGSVDNTARVWDVETGAPVRVFDTDEGGGYYYVDAARFNDRGDEVLLSHVGFTATVREIASGTTRLRLEHDFPVRDAQYFAGDTYALTASGAGHARVWDLRTGQPTFTADAPLFDVPERRRYLPQADPAGRWIAVPRLDGELWLVEPGTGRTRHRLRPPAGIKAVAFSLDGRYVAAGDTLGTAVVWDARTGEQQASFPGLGAAVNVLAFDASGARLLTVSENGNARVWDVASGEPQSILFGQFGQIARAAFDPSGRRVVTAGAGGLVIVWNVEPPPWSYLAEPVLCVGFDDTDEGDLVVGVRWRGDRAEVVHFDPVLGHVVRVAGPRLASVTNAPTECALHAERGVVAAMDASGAVSVNDLHTGEQLLTGQTNQANSLVFGHDGATLAALETEATVRLWRIDSGDERTVSGGTGTIIAAALSPDGRMLAMAGYEPTVTVKEIDRDRVVARLFGHDGGVRVLRYSADGGRLLTAGYDRSVKIWNTRDWTLSSSLEEHEAAIVDAAFDPGGALLATATTSGQIALWDRATGKRLDVHRLARVGRRRGLSFDAQGSRVIALLGGRGFVWQVAAERRTAVEIGEAVRCSVPLTLVEGRMQSLPREARQCVTEPAR
jgi:WD40 repeat protein